MSFVTSAFFIFYLLCVNVYWLMRDYRAQNVAVILFSCFFYGWWSPKYLLLMIGLSLAGYFLAFFLEPGKAHRKVFLIAGVSLFLGCLGFFKYTDFLINSLDSILMACGFAHEFPDYSIVLPLSISFHSFQIIAYLVDVYRGAHDAERNPIVYLCFSFYFPQLVAGPIERAQNLLEQFKYPRVISAAIAKRGITLIVYGFFLKTVIADSAAPIVDSVFTVEQYNGLSVILGTFLFSLQIYCDFLARHSPLTDQGISC